MRSEEDKHSQGPWACTDRKEGADHNLLLVFLYIYLVLWAVLSLFLFWKYYYHSSSSFLHLQATFTCLFIEEMYIEWNYCKYSPVKSSGQVPFWEATANTQSWNTQGSLCGLHWQQQPEKQQIWKLGLLLLFFIFLNLCTCLWWQDSPLIPFLLASPWLCLFWSWLFKMDFNLISELHYTWFEGGESISCSIPGPNTEGVVYGKGSWGGRMRRMDKSK